MLEGSLSSHVRMLISYIFKDATTIILIPCKRRVPAISATTV